MADPDCMADLYMQPVPKYESGPSGRAARRTEWPADLAELDRERIMGRNSNDKWTEEEDKRLLELRTKGKSNYWIAAALRRSLTSVAARLYVLKKRSANGAKVTLSVGKRLQWNSADEARSSN
jgi:hypothetical protein